MGRLPEEEQSAEPNQAQSKPVMRSRRWGAVQESGSSKHTKRSKCWVGSAGPRQLSPMLQGAPESWVSGQGTWQGLYDCWSRLLMSWSSGGLPVRLWRQLIVSETVGRVFRVGETDRPERMSAVGILSARPADP